MPVLATDDFNRANGGLGANWTSVTASPLTIISNKVGPTDNNFDSRSFWNGVVWPNDQYSQVAVTADGTNLDSGPGPMVRCDATGANLYSAAVMDGTTNNVKLIKIVASVETNIATRSQAWTIGDILRLEAQGTTLRLFRNGVQLGADVVDASIASGSAGAAYHEFASTSRLDDFEGGDFAPSIPPVIPVSTRKPNFIYLRQNR